MQVFSKIMITLSVGALLLCAIPATAAKPVCGNDACEGKESRTCPEDCPSEVDVPVCAELFSYPGARIRDDGFGPYCYSDEDSIWAFFQHEAGPTSDLYVNMPGSDRVFEVDFGAPLSTLDDNCIPSDWINGSTTGWRIFVDEVDNVPVGTDWTNEWEIFCGSPDPDGLCDIDSDGWPYVRRRGEFHLTDRVKKVEFRLHFQSADWQFDVNEAGIPTSYLKVYHPSANVWEIKPELILVSDEEVAVAALLRIGTGRNNKTNCGYFSMPLELLVWPDP